MIAELSTFLVESTLALSAALLVVLLLRRPLRNLCGARGAYALWMLVPVALLAVVLPAPEYVVDVSVASSVEFEPGVDAAVAAPVVPFDPRPWLIGAWCVGALGLATAFARQQLRFRRSLGRLQARGDGSWLSERPMPGPAVIGAWRGRIVLPADFDFRYDELEQDLVLRHERVHLARRDLGTNAFATALRCVYWFNPLLHFAVGRFRLDQELATDAVVLAQRPDARRPYADAMLKTQLLFDPPPLGCHWQSAHPLKERIAMLKRPLPGMLRYAAGFVFALVLSVASGYLAWAAQPAQARAVDRDPAKASVQVRIVREGYPVEEARYSATPGAKLGFSAADDLRLDFSFESITADNVMIAASLSQHGEQVAQPRLQIKRGTQGSFAIGEGPYSETPESVRVEFDVAAVEHGESSELPRASPNASGAEATTAAVQPAKEDGASRRHTPPRYPAAALKAHSEGKVVLKVLVSGDGVALESELDPESSSPGIDPLLVSAAQDAVKGWRFEPARDATGKSIGGQVLVPITFAMTGKPDGQPVDVGASYARVIPPKYPEGESVKGVVLLRVLVGEEGEVSDADVEQSSGHSALDSVAEATVRRWRFNPAMRAGEAIPQYVAVPIEFALDQPSGVVPRGPTSPVLDTIHVRRK